MNVFLIVVIVVVVLLLAIGLSIASYAGAASRDVYNKYKKAPNSKSLTALDFALGINEQVFNGDVTIKTTKGELSDFYLPSKKLMAISEGHFKEPSIAALTVVAHELGHALQDKENPKRFKNFARFKVAGSIVSFLILPLLIAGIILMFVGDSMLLTGAILAGSGLLIFFLSLIFKLHVIGIEKEASVIAINFLKLVFTPDELKIAKKILNAAKLSYWGDFFKALLSWTFLTRKTKRF